MKKLILVGALILGSLAVANAGCPTRKWNLSLATGTFNQVFTKYGYLLSIRTSSGTTNSLGDYGVAYSTQPRLATGGTNAGFNDLWAATATIIPPMVFRTTATLSSGDNLSGVWNSPDDCGAYVETDMYWNQSAEKSGGANQATIIWSK